MLQRSIAHTTDDKQTSFQKTLLVTSNRIHLLKTQHNFFTHHITTFILCICQKVKIILVNFFAISCVLVTSWCTMYYIYLYTNVDNSLLNFSEPQVALTSHNPRRLHSVFTDGLNKLQTHQRIIQSYHCSGRGFLCCTLPKFLQYQGEYIAFVL